MKVVESEKINVILSSLMQISNTGSKNRKLSSINESGGEEIISN